MILSLDSAKNSLFPNLLSEYFWLNVELPFYMADSVSQVFFTDKYCRATKALGFNDKLIFSMN